MTADGKMKGQEMKGREVKDRWSERSTNGQDENKDGMGGGRRNRVIRLFIRARGRGS